MKALEDGGGGERGYKIWIGRARGVIMTEANLLEGEVGGDRVVTIGAWKPSGDIELVIISVIDCSWVQKRVARRNPGLGSAATRIPVEPKR